MKLASVRVQLGLAFDGAVPATTGEQLGQVTVGPKGFLSLLETQLGIAAVDTTFSRRLVQYLACVEQVHHPGAFYYRSYKVDPFAVARALLRWRDDWYLAGWRGDFNAVHAAKLPGKLADMAAIEQVAREQVDLNTGQRIARALERLAGQPVAIGEIVLHDALEDFPPLWSRLIRETGAKLQPPAALKAAAAEGSDLHALQEYLLSKQAGKLQLSGDNSVLALRAAVASDTALLLAAHAGSVAGAGASVALLAEVRGELLDEANTALGIPRAGFTALSSARPLFQLLALSLDLVWAPLNVNSLLQFLSQPFGPLPRRVRRALAREVAQQPGINGTNWQRKIEQLLEAEEPGRRVELQQKIDFWLDPPRFPPNEGADVVVFEQRAARLLDWMHGRFERESDHTLRAYFSVALNQLREFLHALERLRAAGYARLSRDQVLRLVDDVKGSGAALSDRKAQLLPGVAPVLRAAHSAAFCSALDHVIWWDCQASDRLQRWPWSQEERQGLAAAGVQLQQEAQRMAWLGRAWERPLLSAGRQCILVLHDDADRHHPVWDRITANVSGIPVYDINSESARRVLQMQLEDVAPRELPVKKRWWRLPANLQLRAREAESYSSLEAFVYSPYQWLLRYQARIDRGDLAPVESNNMLQGNLAHRLVEHFFSEHRDIAGIDIDSVPGWVDEHLPVLLQQEGATLLLAGRQAECAAFSEHMRTALRELVRHLQQASAAAVVCEHREEANFCGGKLAGFIDLLVHCQSGEEIIVDMKWGGLRYRRESLRDGSYLQLAVYAQLRGSSAPNLSYFILRDAQMLSLQHGLFSEAQVIHDAGGENCARLWQRFESTWQWRNAQLGQGLVEVTVQDTEPDERSQPPEDGLAIDATHDRFNQYSALTGWLLDEQGS